MQRNSLRAVATGLTLALLCVNLTHAEPFQPKTDSKQAESGAAYEHLDEDLPLTPERAAELTRRAVDDALGPHRGFLPWIAHSTSCYEDLVLNDIERRIYCLQFDATAMAIEQSVPQEWRERDAQVNDYFTRERFEARQRRFAPPSDSTPNVEQRRNGVLNALAVMRNIVMEAWVIERREERIEEGDQEKP